MRRFAWAAAFLLAAILFASEAQARVTRVPARCSSQPATRLCAIHFHRARANHYRAKLGLRRIPYHWIAERHPARRDRILTYWVRAQAHAHHRWVNRPRAPWSASWYAAAMCVHSKEGAWDSNTGNGYYGGMQFDSGSWLANGGGAYASRADLASPFEQLLVAYHYWDAGATGPGGSWGPWPNTAAACGVL